MIGFRTVIWNLALVMLGAGLPYLAGIDWTQYVSPAVAAIIVAAVNILLRLMTSTPVFKGKA